MEIPISQDIRKFKTKDVGSFSFKEAAFVALAFLTGFITYKLSGTLELAVVPAGILLVFGFLKPYGLTFTQFIRTVVKEQMLPSVYYYETDFEYDKDVIKELYGDDVRFSDEWTVIQTVSSEHKFKPSKTEKAKLFKS